MVKKTFGSELLLLLTAAIWGFAFVAQRQGAQYVSPLVFNFLRFTLGAFVIGIFAFLNGSFNEKLRFPQEGIILGIVLFIAASLQQIGIAKTTAGSAGFITGLYVVFVPLIGLIQGQKQAKSLWLAVLMSVTGLVCINLNQEFTVTTGNLIILAGAVFWALHVQLIDKFTQNHDTLQLAFWQFSVCAVLSFLLGNPGAGLFSIVLITGYRPELWLPIIYSGIFSIGIAFTLQIHAQKQVAPVPATLILCLEGVFALLGGWLLLNEKFSFTILLGAALILSAMLMSILTQQNKPQLKA